MGRYEYTFLYFLKYTYHEIATILEDEDTSAAIFIGPIEGCTSHKDSAYKHDWGIINLIGSQLKSPTETLRSHECQIKVRQNKASNKTNNIEQIYIESDWTYDSLLLVWNLIVSEA